MQNVLKGVLIRNRNLEWKNVLTTQNFSNLVFEIKRANLLDI